MKFVVDESTGTTVVAHLREAGHDVVAMAESALQVEDAAVLIRAVAEGRILITNDGDLGALAFQETSAGHGEPLHLPADGQPASLDEYRHSLVPYGVVLLRTEGEGARSRLLVLQSALEHPSRLTGHLTVATEGGVQSRPIRRS